MAGDGRSTDDITLPLLFLFHKEGNILLEALKEYREVEVLLSDKARDRGATLGCSYLSVKAILSVFSFIWANAGGCGVMVEVLLWFMVQLFFHFPLFLVVNCNSAFPLLSLLCLLKSSLDEQQPYSKVNLSLGAWLRAVSTFLPFVFFKQCFFSVSWSWLSLILFQIIGYSIMALSIFRAKNKFFYSVLRSHRSSK